MKSRNLVWAIVVVVLAAVAFVIFRGRQASDSNRDVSPAPNSGPIAGDNGTKFSEPPTPVSSVLTKVPESVERTSLGGMPQPVNPTAADAPFPASDPERHPTAVITVAALHPILGGSDAFALTYRNVSLQDRQTRLAELEQGLAAYLETEHDDKADFEGYQSLKDELYWLRDNISPKKP